MAEGQVVTEVDIASPFLEQVKLKNEERISSMMSESSSKEVQAKQTPPPSAVEKPDIEEAEIKEAQTQEASQDKDQESHKSEPEPEQQEEEVVVDPLQSAKTNKKKYRTKDENLKALRDDNLQKQNIIDTLKSQLENILEHSSVQEELGKRDKRIEELKAYEDLMGLYKTEGFKEKFYDGVDNLINQAGIIASDYEVDKEVIAQAVSLTNRRELNEFLGQYFDIVGIQDIRQYIIDAQNLIKERSVAESRPLEAKQELLKRLTENRASLASKHKEALKGTMKRSWDSMLTVYSDQENGIDFLKAKVGDELHSKKRDEVLDRAQNEYGKVMAVMADSGARNLPDSLVKALAARFQLSEVAGELTVQNTLLKKELAELKGELKQDTQFERPLAQGNNAGTAVQTKSKEIDNVAAHVFQRARNYVRQKNGT